jgi:hypothetical protein
MATTEKQISTKLTHPSSRSRLKALVATTPVVGPVARALVRNPVIEGLRGLLRRRLKFTRSSSYWEQRYRSGGTRVGVLTDAWQNSRQKP